MSTNTLVCPFLNNDPVFAYGVEVGMFFAEMRMQQEVHGYYCRQNQEQILLMANRLGWRVVKLDRCEDRGKPWGQGLVLDRNGEALMLSVLLVTAGERAVTLRRAIDGILAQLIDADELVVVADGWDAFRKASETWPDCRLFPDGPHGDWGHSVRNAVTPTLRGPWVIHHDDDDTLAPGSLANVRRHVAKFPLAVHLYRAQWPDPNYVTWNRKEICQGNVGTGSIVHRVEHTGTFLPFHGGDANFVQTTVDNSGVDPVWHEGFLIRINH